MNKKFQTKVNSNAIENKNFAAKTVKQSAQKLIGKVEHNLVEVLRSGHRLDDTVIKSVLSDFSTI